MKLVDRHPSWPGDDRTDHATWSGRGASCCGWLLETSRAVCQRVYSGALAAAQLCWFVVLSSCPSRWAFPCFIHWPSRCSVPENGGRADCPCVVAVRLKSVHHAADGADDRFAGQRVPQRVHPFRLVAEMVCWCLTAVSASVLLAPPRCDGPAACWPIFGVGLVVELAAGDRLAAVALRVLCVRDDVATLPLATDDLLPVGPGRPGLVRTADPVPSALSVLPVCGGTRFIDTITSCRLRHRPRRELAQTCPSVTGP